MLSRVADSLYWMSRYLERAEHTARMIDVNVVLLLDQSPTVAQEGWTRLLASLSATLPEDKEADPRGITTWLTFDRSNAASIMASMAEARDNARQVREQISSEMWEQINRLYLRLNRSGIDDIWSEQPHEFFQRVKDGAHLFQGIADATMTQGEGWYFMELGRHLERVRNTTMLLDAHAAEFARNRDPRIGVDDYLTWIGLLKSRTAFEAYCQVYTADLRPDRIAEFLLLNPEFPQSVRFAAGRAHAALQAIGRSTGLREAANLERLAGRLRSALDYAHIDEIMAGDLRDYLKEIRQECSRIHTALYETYIAPPLASALPA
jgi:uncharacterized alpha-E superfamily protein